MASNGLVTSRLSGRQRRGVPDHTPSVVVLSVLFAALIGWLLF